MDLMYSGLSSFGLLNSTIGSRHFSHSSADMLYKNNSIINFMVACCSQLNACSCSSRGTFLRGYREPDKYNLLGKYAREGLDQSAYISGS